LTIAKYGAPVEGQHNPIQNAAYYIGGQRTLSANFVVSANSDTYVAGDSIDLWFTCNMTAAGHTVIVQGQNLTGLIAIGESVDVLVTMKFNGKWYIECISADISDAISTAFDSYVPPVLSVAGKTGTITLSKGDVGLNYVDNTADNNKPVSIAQGVAIANAQSEAEAVGAAAQITANTASDNADAALNQLLVLTKQLQIATWAAGTQSIVPVANLLLINVGSVNGSVTLNLTAPSAGTFGANPYSEITIVLGFTGSYTVTAGSNCVFDTITGAASVTQTLSLIWNGTVYVKK
jgi:hypothetical protein